jgi:hypothetical protein
MLLELVINHISVTVKTGKNISSIPANMILIPYDSDMHSQKRAVIRKFSMFENEK